MLRPGLSLVLLTASIFLNAASCKESVPGKPATSCEGVICTMMFASVSIQVNDANGRAVLLDSSQTLIAKNGLLISKAAPANGGIYTVVDDSYQKPLAQRTEEFIFRGYKGGHVVAEERFSISADCCHVSKVSGPEVITIK